MYGRPEHSLAYCTKQDSEAFVHGELPRPGKRNDIHEAVEAINNGATVRDLANGPITSQVAVVKFHKGLTTLRSLVVKERTKAPYVVWIHGPTGTGKTRCAFQLGRALTDNADDDIWISSCGLKWFDGFDGHTVAIFDDFRAKHVTSFAFLLRLLDRYPLRVEFKGGFVTWQPEYIFITCPYSPERCFAKRKEFVPEDIAQLNRRLNRIDEFDEPQSTGMRLEWVKSVLKSIDETDEL